MIGIALSGVCLAMTSMYCIICIYSYNESDSEVPGAAIVLLGFVLFGRLAGTLCGFATEVCCTH